MLAAVVALLSTSTAQSRDKSDIDDMCDIVGTVDRLKLVQRSPWTDGTPSTMMKLETHISVRIDDRKPHDTQASDTHSCHKETKGEKRTYKLCSTTKVKSGDRIVGTEGTQTGSSKAIGCLFDLVVLPSKT